MTSEHAGRYAEDVIVRQNDVRQNVYTGIAIGGYDTKRGGTKRVRIEQNQLIGNDTKGLEGGQLLVQHDVHDNKIIGNTFDGSLSVAHYFKTSSGNQFEKNTFQHTNVSCGATASYKTEQSFLKAVRKVEGRMKLSRTTPRLLDPDSETLAACSVDRLYVTIWTVEGVRFLTVRRYACRPLPMQSSVSFGDSIVHGMENKEFKLTPELIENITRNSFSRPRNREGTSFSKEEKDDETNDSSRD